MTTLAELEAWGPAGSRLRLGFDLARVSSIAESLECFGDRFAGRIFTAGELAYARSGSGAACAERLAARFAAKEAVVKALAWSEAGVNLRDIEVVKQGDGGCTIALHGEAERAAGRLGVQHILVSLSHDGDCAGAVVHALLDPSLQTAA